MFRNINEWRANRDRQNRIAEYADYHYLSFQSPETDRDIQHIVSAALALALDKDSTIKAVNDIFTDPLQAPENISVPFVIDNLDKIVDEIRTTPDEEFATPIGYTETMLNTVSPLEMVYMTENANELKDASGVIVEGNIVYVPDVTLLNPVHNKRVIDHLKAQNTVNLINHIKWTRRTRK